MLDSSSFKFFLYRCRHNPSDRICRYIVTCPRAAAPFDAAAQAGEYPERLLVAMVLLAEELRERAGHFNGLGDGMPLRLQVTDTNRSAAADGSFEILKI